MLRTTNLQRAAVLLATLALAPTALAQSDADRETAQALFKQGNEARASGDVRTSLGKYKVAYALVQTPVIAVALGKAQMEVGELVEAHQTLLGVERLPVLANESARSTAARDEARALSGQVAQRIPTVTLKIHATAGARSPSVTIDGVAIPEVALDAPRKLNPGDHVAIATVGSATKQTLFHLDPAETRDLVIEVPATDIAGVVAAPVIVPVPVQPTPTIAPPPLPVTPVVPQPPPSPSGPSAHTHSRTPAYIALGVGGAGVVVTTVFGILALGNKSSLDTACGSDKTSCPASQSSNLSSLKTDSIVSDVGLGFAIAGVGVGSVLLLLNRGESSASAPPDDKRVAFRVAPWVGVGAAGMKGSF